MQVSVFIATSLDGFIATAEDGLDWLPGDDCEPHGYEEFIASVDALVVGRRTYETVLTFEDWPYQGKRVVVLSSQPLKVSATGGPVERMGGTPKEILARLEAQGIRRIYLDGGITIQRFLREGLVDRIIQTRVPVLLGGGIPLFGTLPRELRYRHVATRSFAGGLVQSEYELPA